VALRLARLAAALMAVSACIFAQTSVPNSSSSGTSSSRALADRYCVGCHSQKAKTGGVVLEGLDWTHPGANAAVLEKVIRKVRTGEMPPPGLPRPDAGTAGAFTKGLEDALDQYAAANPNPGRPAV